MPRALHHSRPHLQVQHRDDATVVNFLDRSIVGEPVVSTVGQELLRLVEQENVRQLILNLGNVEDLTSRTLSDLISCHKTLTRRGGTLVLCNPSTLVREILNTTRLDPLFEIRAEPVAQAMGNPGRSGLT